MSCLFWLSDDAWAVIEPHLPKNRPGARRVDDRRVISGFLYVLQAAGGATRYDKLACNFLSAVALVAIAAFCV